jgi:hypothetical protein
MTEYKHYVPLTVKCLEVCGIEHSLRAMRLPKGSENDSFYAKSGSVAMGDKDAALAANLIRAGADHAKAMRGIIAYLEIIMQVGFMIEFETYRHGVECLSTSSAMHGELKDLTGPELAEQKQADLSDKVYTRIITVSYQALRSMYRARKNHRHPDWKVLCKFIEGLPYFDTLIYPEAQKENVSRLLRHLPRVELP